MKLTYNNIRTVSMVIVGFQISKTVIQFLHHHFIVKYYKKPVDVTKHGKWAVITGGANGLGRAFAAEFAKRGMHLILIDKNIIELRFASEFLEKKFDVKPTIIQCDFALTTKNYLHIMKYLIGLDIGILVNNVHELYYHPEFFLDLKNPEEVIERVINNNIYTLTNMCKLVLPGMVKRQRGIIINVGSFLTEFPSPMLAVYAASKAFVEKFSADLNIEHEADGLIIQCLSPGFIDSRWLKTRSSSLVCPTPETYVEHAIPLLGIHDRTVGYYAHSLFIGVVNRINYINPDYGRRLTIACMKLLRDISIRGYL